MSKVSVIWEAADQVKEQIEGRLLTAVRSGPVRLVSCAEVASAKAHIWKSDMVTWCTGCTWWLTCHHRWKGAGDT